LSLIVMKFGGSSVGDADRMKRVAERIVRAAEPGRRVIVVVSAMGDTTDDLIDLSKKINPNPPAREMDMLLANGEQISIALLSMAIHALGREAVSFTGWQAGITTDASHGRARIADIDPKRVLAALDEGKIVIVAGFQGITPEGEITTLGRGGSDTTAVALAAAVKADLCEIYTDVDGVYSTDPRIVRNARKLPAISYDEMLELAHLGAAVLHPRAVEYAKLYSVPLVVRSSFTEHEGTLVKGEAALEQGIVVSGIACDKNVARISIQGVPDRPGILAKVFTALGNAGVDVDIIVQGAVDGGKADVSFTVSGNDLDKALSVIETVRKDVEYEGVSSETGLAKVSIVGAGMVSNPGVAARMFEVIAGQGVNIKMVSTSEIKVSCVIESESMKQVVIALHSAYGLDTSEQVFVGGPEERR